MELCHSTSTHSINIARCFLCRKQDDSPESEHRNQRSKSRPGCNPNPPAIPAMGSVRLPGLLGERKLQCASDEVREPELAWTQYAHLLLVVQVHRLGKLAGRNNTFASLVQSRSLRLRSASLVHGKRELPFAVRKGAA